MRIHAQHTPENVRLSSCTDPWCLARGRVDAAAAGRQINVQGLVVQMGIRIGAQEHPIGLILTSTRTAPVQLHQRQLGAPAADHVPASITHPATRSHCIRTHPATAAPPRPPPLRRTALDGSSSGRKLGCPGLAGWMVRLLSTHASAEERSLYPLARAVGPVRGGWREDGRRMGSEGCGAAGGQGGLCGWWGRAALGLQQGSGPLVLSVAR